MASPKSIVVDRDTQVLQQEIEALSPWFHNLHLPGGLMTAPHHTLGDFPRKKWKPLARHIPDDLSGWTVLDVGCNAGFYSFELARRGARVTAVDCDEHYLNQARWAADKFGLTGRITFRLEQVYRLADDPLVYDLVWFMGVFYHLRYPLLALDILARRTGRMMVFQTLTMPGKKVIEPPEDFELDDRRRLTLRGWPQMAFIEKALAGDYTNWWAPNHACVEAMLRSSRLEVIARPAHEIYICTPRRSESSSNHGIEALNDQQYYAALGKAWDDIEG